MGSNGKPLHHQRAANERRVHDRKRPLGCPDDLYDESLGDRYYSRKEL